MNIRKTCIWVSKSYVQKVDGLEKHLRINVSCESSRENKRSSERKIASNMDYWKCLCKGRIKMSNN